MTVSTLPDAPPIDSRLRRISRHWQALLFPDRWTAFATLAALVVLALVIPPALDWAIISARFYPPTPEACVGARGACWPFVTSHLSQFVYGFYPVEQRWRIDLGALAMVAWIGLLFVRALPHRLWLFVAFVVLYPSLAYILFRGGVLGLVPVQEDRWGGLFVTLFIAVSAMSASIPIGTGLALAKRSANPILNVPATIFIECFRGIPLIAILFAAVVMLPLFIPDDVPLSPLLRVLIANVFYASAFMAEVIRGGLQSVPAGQSEAASSLGLGRLRTLGLVTLPQALYVALPSMVNTSVSLVKDTSLVVIVGIFDLLGIVQAAATDPKWLGFAAEGYVAAGAVYVCLCLGLARFGAWMERHLGRGLRMKR